MASPLLCKGLAMLHTRHWLQLAVLVLAGCGRLGFEAQTELSPDAGAPEALVDGAAALTHVRVHAVLVANDDGQQPVNISPTEIVSWLDFASKTFESAGIVFDFTPSTDVESVRSTLLNGMMGEQDIAWNEERALGDSIAVNHPGELVVLFRHGPGTQPTGSAFSWTDFDFVAAPGFSVTTVCGHQNRSLLSLVIGHYLGLSKTFLGTYASASDASAALTGAGGNTSIFDGDGLADTAPDPNIAAVECTGDMSIDLGGASLALPRDNVMSFLDSAEKRLTPQQGVRVHELLARRFGGQGAL